MITLKPLEKFKCGLHQIKGGPFIEQIDIIETIEVKRLKWYTNTCKEWTTKDNQIKLMNGSHLKIEAEDPQEKQGTREPGKKN